MAATFASRLVENGPDACVAMPVARARAWAMQEAKASRENFSVLSAVLPPHLREDFAALYAYCRWSDDLADEIADRERSRELLSWWRHELDACFNGSPRHPVFVALGPTIERCDLPKPPFAKLLDAFEQDQHVTRYQTWDQLLAYCTGSADPVGQLVLMIAGQPRTDAVFVCSNAICTALQLTNHWQDVQRDILGRDRIYLPNELHSISDFDSRLLKSARQGYAIDHTFLQETRELIRACVDRTWPLYQQGERLLQMVSSDIRPVIWLFLAGGANILRKIEMWDYETALHRPRLNRAHKSWLVGRAWWMQRRSRNTVPAKSASS
ncbi:MAG: squalene synthase HpnC [Phycisphaerales bacterium]